MGGHMTIHMTIIFTILFSVLIFTFKVVIPRIYKGLPPLFFNIKTHIIPKAVVILNELTLNFVPKLTYLLTYHMGGHMTSVKLHH